MFMIQIGEILKSKYPHGFPQSVDLSEVSIGLVRTLEMLRSGELDDDEEDPVEEEPDEEEEE